MNQDTHTVQATRPIVIQGHGYLVLGVNSNSSTNGGILVDYQYQHFNLSNREDQVRLEDACGNLVDEFAYPGPRGWPKVRAGVAMERVGSKNLKKGVGWKRVRARLQSGDRGNPGQGPWPPGLPAPLPPPVLVPLRPPAGTGARLLFRINLGATPMAWRPMRARRKRKRRRARKTPRSASTPVLRP